MKKIGEHLIEQGLLSPSEIERALKIQQDTGSLLGEILQAEGLITAYKFYKEFAAFKNLPFVNLEEYSVNNSVLINADKQEYIEKNYIPFDVKEKVIYIATTETNEDFEKFLTEKYKSYKLFITSPYDIAWALQKRFSKEYTHSSSEGLFETQPELSSKKIMVGLVPKILFLLICIFLIYIIINPNLLYILLFLVNIVFFLSIISKLLFFVTGVIETKITKQQNKLDIEDSQLPIYSILVPLFKEKKQTISSLINALTNLDYPKEKLDIKLVCEDIDLETIQTIKSLKPPANFQIIKVPDTYPRTKPKACNYALNFCKGEFITIYDAEDRPEASQLKKVLSVFYQNQNSGYSNLVCVQARLNFYNRNENILTKLFAIEYASLFDYILKGLKKLNIPIPLGGTSNHFRVNVLKSLYAWDPYNVTEDADVGIRLALAGMKTELVDSITLEEAPLNINSWINQRSRWIKGYFQTFFVHIKQTKRLYKNHGLASLFGFIMFVGVPGFIYLATIPVIILTTIDYLFSSSQMSLYLIQFCFLNLVLTLFSNFFISFYIIISRNCFKMLDAAIIFPIYWMLHCIASYQSLYQLIKKPHHWNKTEHGVSKYVVETSQS
jgi:cellulose synthase/poly-beta-1,6-N-acetylglucosamine synthase-like glycosyltransferase